MGFEKTELKYSMFSGSTKRDRINMIAITPSLHITVIVLLIKSVYTNL